MYFYISKYHTIVGPNQGGHMMNLRGVFIVQFYLLRPLNSIEVKQPGKGI